MIFEESYGIIPLKKINGKWVTYLIQNKSGNHWGFPKGRANISETQKEVALRELKEETNLSLVRFLSEETIVEQYTFKRNSTPISKKVHYYLAEVTGDAEISTDEILDGKWVDVKSAKNLLTYSQSKKIADQVEIILQKLII
ncbi:MAG: NUDIX domain-containing protein [Parachlamydiales bacterium]|jgi:8-oxo-dGTP pyrophosphatase MutT (NUDIX family)